MDSKVASATSPKLCPKLTSFMIKFIKNFNKKVLSPPPNHVITTQNKNIKKKSKKSSKSIFAFILILIAIGSILMLTRLAYYLCHSVEIDHDKASKNTNSSVVATFKASQKQPQQIKQSDIEDELTLRRRESIRKMTADAWHAYERLVCIECIIRSFAHSPISSKLSKIDVVDRFKPQTYVNSVPTVLSSLTTLVAMELNAEFGRAREWIYDKIWFAQGLMYYNEYMSVPSVVSQFAGSLISYAALTQQSMFAGGGILKKLEPAYQTATGLSYGAFNPVLNRTLSDTFIYPSAIGEQALVYQYLENFFGKRYAIQWVGRRISSIRKYVEVAEKPHKFHMAQVNVQTGNLTSSVDRPTEQATQLLIDLTKWYILLGEKALSSDQRWYEDALDSLEQEIMMIKSSINETIPTISLCHLGSIILLRATIMEKQTNQSKQIDRDHKLANELVKHCDHYSVRQIVSPELAESYFLLHRLTHKPKYRTYAWEMVQKIQRDNQTESGYLNFKVQPPHFLSATLKYLYLIFTPDSVLPLDQWVFNSAGHPLPICGESVAYPSKRC